MLKLSEKALIAVCALLLVFCCSFTAMAESIVTVNAAKVNVRAGAGTDFDKLGSALAGESYIALREADGWYQIVFAGAEDAEAWISADYVKLSHNEELPASVSPIDTGINVRSGAGTSYEWLGQLSFGQKYTVLGESGFWYEISFAAGKRSYVAKWLCSRYEALPKPPVVEPPVVEPPVVEPPVTPNAYAAAAALKHGKVNTEKLNLRQANSTTSESLGLLDYGTAVAIYERSGEWYKVVTEKGALGYVFAAYISLDNSYISLQKGAVVQPPKWDEGAATCGIMQLKVNEYGAGVHILITSDKGIAYRLEEGSDTLSFISDMSFSGASGSIGGIEWKLAGESYNRLNITAKGLEYSLTESADKHTVEILVSSYKLLDKIIYIDPGHSVWYNGVLDPGAVGKNGTKESEVVYAISLKLKSVLESYGATVYLTHNGQTKLSRPERCALANDMGADLFICIHANASTDRRVKGTMVYTYAPSGKGNYDRTGRLSLANNILQSIVDNLSLRNYGVLENGFDVLTYTKMPAVLIETAFISNEEEEAKLKNAAWQQEMAQAIAKGICAYFGYEIK